VSGFAGCERLAVGGAQARRREKEKRKETDSNEEEDMAASPDSSCLTTTTRVGWHLYKAHARGIEENEMTTEQL
jgi:hypothetical protein